MTDPQPTKRTKISENWDSRIEAMRFQQSTDEKPGPKPEKARFRIGSLIASLVNVFAGFGICVGFLMAFSGDIEVGLAIVGGSVGVFLFGSILLVLYEIADGLRKKGYI